MQKIIAILALFAALTSGVAAAEESVDCFYEFNANNPACQK